jgi:hypothetical protein
MSFSSDNGYTALTIDQIIELIIEGINEQFGTSYTSETFLGTNFYKFYYTLAQKIQQNEIKMSEIFLKLQDYFDTTNETILEPHVTANGIVAVFNEAGYIASVDAPTVSNKGTVSICVDVDETADDYATNKLEICEIIKENVAAGILTTGDQTESLTLTNGQSFDFSFHLPDRQEKYLKLTLTVSRNNQFVIDDIDTVKDKLLTNIASRYSLGKDFEPKKYYTMVDAPYCSDILLEYSDDGITYTSDIHESLFDDLFEFALDRISIVEA